jgi:Ion channel
VATDEVVPTGAERWLEDRFPGYRFGTVLVLLSLTFVVMASSPPGAWARILTVGLQGLTLLAALLAARAGRRLFRVALLVVVLAFLASVASVLVSTSNDPTGVFFGLNVLLVATAPVVIGRALYRRQVVDLRTVLGAICVYILLGMLFAFVYGSIDLLGPDPFFVQTSHATMPDYLYFSFVTQTTVGYGDFTAASDLGRSLAVVEALVGQLYLVTIIAVLVSRMAGRPAPSPPAAERADASEPAT